METFLKVLYFFMKIKQEAHANVMFLLSFDQIKNFLEIDSVWNMFIN